MAKTLELHFSGFRWVRKFIGGRWASDGSGFNSWVRYNHPQDDEDVWQITKELFFTEDWGDPK